MSGGVHWSTHLEAHVAVVTLVGSIDEEARLLRIVAEVAQAREVRLDLSGVTRINSRGIREWLNLMKSMPERAAIVLEKCSPVMVAQMNMISSFVGRTRVASLFAPFACESCGHEENVLFELRDGEKPLLDVRRCPSCGRNALALEEAEESYVGFIK